MPDWREAFGPEAWLRNDPFVEELVQADDLIIDYRFNYDWFGKTAGEGEQMAAHIERMRLTYELETLYRWLALP